MKNIGKGVFNLENFGFFFGNGVRKKNKLVFIKLQAKWSLSEKKIINVQSGT